MPPTPPEPEFEALLEYLSSSRGFDFGAYKRTTVRRRTLSRMQALRLQTFGEYLDFLQVDPEEFDHFFDAILIKVTSFFRDPAAWDVLARSVVPSILERKDASEPIRVWTAGCATGEEAYTLAILFVEALGTEEAIQRVKIYATDLDDQALTRARAAIYPERSVEAVPEALRTAYFEPQQEMLSFRRDLRRLVIFGRHDLLRDAPISHVDLVSCRNTLMYFNSESQARIIERFMFALREGGYLFLGKAETLLSKRREVVPIDLKLRIFEVPPVNEIRSRLLVSAENGDNLPPLAEEHIREKAFDLDPVAQIVVDANLALALVNDTARRVFHLRDKDVGRPLQDFEVSYRPVDLRSLIDRAVHERRAISAHETNWGLPDGTARWIAPQAIPLVDDSGLVGVKLVFTDITAYKALQSEVETAHAEIETAYEELQSTNEELETTNEELHSTVEELETTNEELQSTNEELETTNEELESTNEELQTVNEVMRERTDELDQANGFLNAILTSLGAGVVVVNRSMEVQLWNARSEEQWGLRAEEVRGKSLLGLDFGLPVQEILPAIHECLASGSSESIEQVRAHNRRGHPVECTVSCQSLRLDGSSAPNGVILLVRDRELSADGAS